MKHAVCPLIVALSFTPQWAVADGIPRLIVGGSLQFGWQRTDEAEGFLGPSKVDELLGRGHLGGLVYGDFENGLSYGLQFWASGPYHHENPMSLTRQSVDREIGAAAYIGRGKWKFWAGLMDDAYRATLGTFDIGETVGDVPANTFLDLGTNEGSLRYTGGPSLRFDLNYSDFTLSASLSDDHLEMPGDSGGDGPTQFNEPVVAFGLRWEKELNWGNAFIAGAIQSSEYTGDYGGNYAAGNPDYRGISAGVEVGGLKIKGVVSEGPVTYYLHVADVRAKYRGASIEYKFNDWTVGANYGRQTPAEFYSTSIDPLIDGEGRAIWVTRKLPHNMLISAAWSHTDYVDDSTVPEVEVLSIGFIKRF